MIIRGAIYGRGGGPPLEGARLTGYGVLGSRWSGGQLLLSKELQISIRLAGVHRE